MGLIPLIGATIIYPRESKGQEAINPIQKVQKTNPRCPLLRTAKYMQIVVPDWCKCVLVI